MRYDHHHQHQLPYIGTLFHSFLLDCLFCCVWKCWYFSYSYRTESVVRWWFSLKLFLRSLSLFRNNHLDTPTHTRKHSHISTPRSHDIVWFHLLCHNSNREDYGAREKESEWACAPTNNFHCFFWCVLGRFFVVSFNDSCHSYLISHVVFHYCLSHIASHLYLSPYILTSSIPHSHSRLPHCCTSAHCIAHTHRPTLHASTVHMHMHGIPDDPELGQGFIL